MPLFEIAEEEEGVLSDFMLVSSCLFTLSLSLSHILVIWKKFEYQMLPFELSNSFLQLFLSLSLSLSLSLILTKAPMHNNFTQTNTLDLSLSLSLSLSRSPSQIIFTQRKTLWIKNWFRVIFMAASSSTSCSLLPRCHKQFKKQTIFC